MIIDMHTHIFPPEMIQHRQAYGERDGWFDLLYSNPRTKMATADQLVVAMRRSGIDRSVTFGFAFADSGLCHEGNAYVLQSAAQSESALVPFAVINPKDATLAFAEARACLEHGARGIGELMPEGQGFSWSDWHLLDPLMELARAYSVPVMIHVNEQVGHPYPGKGRYGVAEAFAFALRYPENLIILPHWGGGLPFYELMPEVREALRNVYYDTAASIFLYDAAIFRHVLAWAPHKVLFGTDYPLLGQKRFLDHIQTAGLEEALRQQLLGQNAFRILSLGPTGSGGKQLG